MEDAAVIMLPDGSCIAIGEWVTESRYSRLYPWDFFGPKGDTRSRRSKRWRCERRYWNSAVGRWASLIYTLGDWWRDQVAVQLQAVRNTRRQRLGEKKYVELEVRVVKVTEAAMLVVVEGAEVWFPKSEISLDDSEVSEEGDEGELCVAEWIAKEKGVL